MKDNTIMQISKSKQTNKMKSRNFGVSGSTTDVTSNEMKINKNTHTLA
jgi:hypothetical protein